MAANTREGRIKASIKNFELQIKIIKGIEARRALHANEVNLLSKAEKNLRAARDRLAGLCQH